MIKNKGVTQTEQTAKPTIYNFEIDSIGNPIIRRNVLQAHHGLLHPKDGNDLEPFQFENCDNNRWELNNDLVPDKVNPLVLDSNDKTPIIPTTSQAFVRMKKGSASVSPVRLRATPTVTSI